MERLKRIYFKSYYVNNVCKYITSRLIWNRYLDIFRLNRDKAKTIFAQCLGNKHVTRTLAYLEE